MAFGSDLDVEIPGHTRGEMAAAAIENYVEAGIPAKTTLQIWTINGANLLGLANERGSLKPGMFADIIATRQNPLDDIHALQHVTFVLKNGQVVKEVSAKMGGS